ncbi:acetyltransferase, GNAT family [Pseudohyphozyma bogoriensis]|nr:acetyltransferase, GNAT family [Pseudohyphozyma bogoriensis]
MSPTVTVPSPSLRELISSTSPLLFSPSHEPYLPIASHPGFILTPARLPDVKPFVEGMNSPSVSQWLYGPPNPVTEDWAAKRVQDDVDRAQKVLDEWELGVMEPPIRTIRFRKDGEPDVYVGDIFFRRDDHLPGIKDEAERAAAVKLNMERKRGDKDVVWTQGFFLLSEYGGKGLMSAVLDTLINGFVVPVMNGAHISSGAFAGNEGSRRVHLKAGFVPVESIWLMTRADRGGYLRESWEFEWTREDCK